MSNVTVYPDAGRFMPGMPTRPFIVDGETAERLVASGAFQYETPEVVEGKEPVDLEPIEFTDDHRTVLDIFMPLPVEPAPESEG